MLCVFQQIFVIIVFAMRSLQMGGVMKIKAVLTAFYAVFDTSSMEKIV